jgi:hypothetical protein
MFRLLNVERGEKKTLKKKEKREIVVGYFPIIKNTYFHQIKKLIKKIGFSLKNIFFLMILNH